MLMSIVAADSLSFLMADQLDYCVRIRRVCHALSNDNDTLFSARRPSGVGYASAQSAQLRYLPPAQSPLRQVDAMHQLSSRPKQLRLSGPRTSAAPTTAKRLERFFTTAAASS